MQIAGSVTYENVKAPSVSALSNSSHDSESTPSSKEASQYPSTLTLSTIPIENATTSLPLQEPDVIASTKSNSKFQPAIEHVVPPIAPPRRKKKTKHSASTQSLAVSISFTSNYAVGSIINVSDYRSSEYFFITFVSKH